jgi:membrane fusion protein (multidrug efflux system)
MVRVTADVPEGDFDFVGVGTRVKLHVLSTGRELEAPVSRRAPAADPGTRTVHVEIDVSDPERKIPVNTTAEVRVDVGEPAAATSLPLSAVSVSGGKATIFTVDGDLAHARRLPVLGEAAGNVFFDPKDLAANLKVVSEGRALLQDNDRVTASKAP